ncbi:MAG: DJ-1/PfpI family protein, partial [Planctomycetales bacterium]|nr:DJ-1/PfpI family protein [Planctomycetales bacterium]
MQKKSTKRNTLAVAIYDNLLGYEYSIVAELFGLVRPGTEAFWYDYRPCRVEPGEFTTSHGMMIRPKYGLAELQRAQTVVVPGWRNVDERPRPAFLRGLQVAYRNGARIISVCTGAFVLAHAGLLDGRRATTHWLFAEKFRDQFPQVELLDDSLYVHDGRISTSAGSSAGLDLCLSFIRNDFGAEVASMVARRMVAPVHREGGQSQYAMATILDTDDAD